MSAALIDALREAIDNNQLVVICGAGVSIGATGGDRRAGWAGLIEYGVEWCAANGIDLPGRNGIERASADLRDGDLLSAADKLQRGLEESVQWTRFLNETFDEFGKGADYRVIDEILDLGVPIATTNYDTLISGNGGLVPITWKSKSLLQALKKLSTGVVHLHGVWTEPDTVILSSESYGRLLATEQTLALERAMSLRATVLMIGVGEGLYDPNFGGLSRYLENNFRDTHLLHVRVTREGSDVSPTPPHVRPLTCGATMAQQAEWIRSLNPRRSRPRSGRTRAKRDAASEEGSRRSLLLSPLLQGLGPGGPTLNEFWPSLLIDMRVKLRRHMPPKFLRVSEWLDTLEGTKHVCVIGAPGGGKSTLLRSIALSLEEKGHRFAFRTSQQLSGQSWQDFHHGPLFLDGLDELSESEQVAVAEGLSGSLNAWVWSSCRKDFFERKTPLDDHFTLCEDVVELLPLEPPDIDKFLEHFGDRSMEAAAAVGLVNKWRTSDSRFADLLRVPLNLTLSVFLASDRNSPWTAPGSRHALYEQFYTYFISREVSRLGVRLTDRPWIERGHAEIASSLYLTRQRDRYSLDGHDVNLPANKSRRHLVLRSLLVCEALPDRNLRVRSFVHETVMEWLVARRIFSSFGADSAASAELGIAANDDVNSFIRDMMAALPEEERQELADALTAKYHLASDVRIKEHIVYYVGRLGLADCPALLVEVFRDPPDMLLQRSAALGAILHGHSAIAEDFMKQLCSSTEAETLNRAVQLVYFGDATGDLHSASDTGGPWGRTKSALLHRLSMSDERSLRLRWWDLFTLDSFCRSRDESLSKDDIEIVGNCLTIGSTREMEASRQAMEFFVERLCSPGDSSGPGQEHR